MEPNKVKIPYTTELDINRFIDIFYCIYGCLWFQGHVDYDWFIPLPQYSYHIFTHIFTSYMEVWCAGFALQYN
jgi:hypothetical protein